MDNAIHWFLQSLGACTTSRCASDYPHTASTWPHPRDIIERDFRAAAGLERRKIVREKVAQLYGFDFRLVRVHKGVFFSGVASGRTT